MQMWAEGPKKFLTCPADERIYPPMSTTVFLSNDAFSEIAVKTASYLIKKIFAMVL